MSPGSSTWVLERVEYVGAAAFDVVTDQPFHERALGPAVWVGDVPVTTWDRLEPTHYRFYAFERDVLEAGAPVSIGWLDSAPEQRLRTEITYER